MLNLFRFKIFYAIVLFLCCLAIFLYGVSWVTVLFTNVHRYAWTNIQLIHYKTFIILLIPILIWGCWWSLYVLKNQNCTKSSKEYYYIWHLRKAAELLKAIMDHHPYLELAMDVENCYA